MSPPVRPVSRIVVALALSCIAACSSELASPLPQGDGELAGGAAAGGGGRGAAGAQDAGTSTPPPGNTGSSSGATPEEAGGPPPVTIEAGSPVYPEAGGGSSLPESGPTVPPTSGSGTCATPACATDGNECGCQATNPNGDIVQMGCQAGGECICLVDQQPTGQPFSENGACSDPSSTATQFVMNCQCQ